MMKQKLFITCLILGLAIVKGKAQLEISSFHFIGLSLQNELISDNLLYDLEPAIGNYHGAGFQLNRYNRKVSIGVGITNVSAKFEAVQLSSTGMLGDPIQISSQNRYLSFPLMLARALTPGRYGRPIFRNHTYGQRKLGFHFVLSYVPSFLQKSQSVIRNKNTITTKGEVTEGLFPHFHHTLRFSLMYMVYPTWTTHLSFGPFIGLQNNNFWNDRTSVVDGYNLGIRFKVLFHNILKPDISTKRSGLIKDQKKRLEEKQNQIKDLLEKH